MVGIIKSIKSSTNYSKFSSKLSSTIADLNKRFSDSIFSIFLVNALLVIFQVFYLNLRFEYVNDLVPFWYTRTWGDIQFGQKQFLYFLPVISAFITLVGLGLMIPLKRYFVRHSISLVGYITISANLLLSYSLLRIIFLASKPFEPFINPLYLDLIIPALVAFIGVSFILPRFINYAHDKDLVTSPSLHDHPGMLLAEPSARGGGFIYGIMFLIMAGIYVGFPPYLLAFYLALFLISILGIIDDYQNTHPETKLRLFENPFIRLGALFLIVSLVSLLGTRIFAVSSPLGGVFSISSDLLSALLTTVWVVWVLNVLSWSNGIDGQYAGIVGIASFLLILLALRFVPLELVDKRVAILAAISVGLSLGFVKYTWYPSKIMWGFGAMSAGLVLSTLSILISSKIITSAIIILIPFLDAFVTVLRRIFEKKNPLKGDRGHLHHILLNRGWSIRKIAIFYWLTTAFFGTLGYLTADKFTVQIGLSLAGVVMFVIIILNISFKMRKNSDVKNSAQIENS